MSFMEGTRRARLIAAFKVGAMKDKCDAVETTLISEATGITYLTIVDR
jgi:hypothetical protein